MTPSDVLDARIRQALALVIERSPLPPDLTEHPVPPRRPPRRILAGAAVLVLAVVLGATAVVIGTRGKSPSDLAAGEATYLVPGWVPSDLRLVRSDSRQWGRPGDGGEDRGYDLNFTTGAPGWTEADRALELHVGVAGPNIRSLDDLLRRMPHLASEERLTVQGHPAVRVVEDQSTSLLWVEEPGVVVEISANRLTTDEVLAFADGLQSVDAEEWQAFVDS
jgi:hypothetical protein